MSAVITCGTNARLHHPDSVPLLHMRATVQILPQDLDNNDSYSSSKPYLISLAPLPDAWGLHTKEGEWVPADNNQPYHQQFEHRQEGSNMSEEINKKLVRVV